MKDLCADSKNQLQELVRLIKWSTWFWIREVLVRIRFRPTKFLVNQLRGGRENRLYASGDRLSVDNRWFCSFAARGNRTLFSS